MDKRILGIPLGIFVLAVIVAFFASLPSLYFYQKLSQRLDRIDTTLYVKSSTPAVTTVPATPSASLHKGKEASSSSLLK